MTKQFIKTKDNRKSVCYENDDYKVKISDIDGYFMKKNGSNFVRYDDDVDEDEYIMAEAVKLEVTSKKTGKKTQKRCFQGYSVINDLQNDIENGKKQFGKMFQKIDN